MSATPQATPLFQETVGLVKEHMPRLLREEAKRLAKESNLTAQTLEEAVFNSLKLMLSENTVQNEVDVEPTTIALHEFVETPNLSTGGQSDDTMIRRESPEYKFGQVRAEIEQLQDRIKQLKRGFNDKKDQLRKDIEKMRFELNQLSLNHNKHVQTYTAKIAHLQQTLASHT